MPGPAAASLNADRGAGARKPWRGVSRGKTPNVGAAGRADAVHPIGVRLVRCREAERAFVVVSGATA
jgi:hypothetical protein